MKHSLVFAGVFLATGALVVSAPGVARADLLSSCGNIDVQANASCKLETSGGCSADCTPVHFEAACAAQLEVMCSGQCTASADVNCTASCSGNCEASCNAQPGTFDCEGSCEADCSGSCQGACQSNGNQSQCEATCKGRCGADCHGHCSATPPSATCQARCQASCSGSCTAKANVSCDVDCQANGYANCEAMLTGGCQAQCTEPKGALFCDGQYVDTGNNLQQCLDDLKSVLNITVEGSASGNCSGSQCSGEAQGSVKACSAASGGKPGPGGLFLAGLGAVVAAVVRRRKR